RHRTFRIVGLLMLIASAVILDTILYGTWWGLPLRVVLYTLSLVASGVLGVEFVLAGWTGQAGCESTVLPNLFRRDRPAKIEPCALWDPIDRWETRRKKEKGRSRGPKAGS
ncbi:MAG: hypothetical protein L3J76_00315, partial [Candidatus Hydrothermae bacterium]|nr:hypothetical protein [Candidatus Hydrothermae bacterium]